MQRPGPLRRDGALGRPGRGRLVRRGRRPLLRRRREEALDRGHGQRGLLQRRLGAARRRRALRRRAGGGGHRPRVAHDRLPLAPRGSGAVHEVAPLRHGAQGLDLQRRRLGEVGLRRARPTSSRASPSGTRRASPPTSRPFPTAPRACRRATPPRSRSRSRARRGEGGEGQGLALAGPLLVQGRDPLRGRGPGLAASRSRSTCPRTATTSSTPSSRRARTTAIYTVLLDGKPPDGAAARARAGRRRAPADAVRRLRVRDLRRRGLPGRLAAADEGTPHADATSASARTRPRPATTSASTTSCSRRRGPRRGRRPRPCSEPRRPPGAWPSSARRSPTPTR